MSSLEGYNLGPPIGPTNPTQPPAHVQTHILPPPSLPPHPIPGRPLNLRRETPKPIIRRTESSYVDKPPSPPAVRKRVVLDHHDENEHEHEREQERPLPRTIKSQTAFSPPTPPPSPPPAQPSPLSQTQTNASSAHAQAHRGTVDPDELPTARTVHPAKQAQALREEDPEVVGTELEKARADRREMKGEKPRGTIVEGLEDDQLHALLRRFDQDVTHTLILTSITPLPPSQPDLRRSVLPDVPYSTDILKSNVERLYASSGVGFIRALNEMARLRSWDPSERRRTLYFCSTYFLAWILGLSIPTLIGFLMILIVSPESRVIFFPAVLPERGTPVSAFDPRNERGDETLLGGADRAVGHKSKAEQKEEAAWEFRSLAETFMVKLAVSSGQAGGKQGNAQLGEKKREESSSEHDEDGASVTSIDSDDDFLDARSDHADADAGGDANGERIDPSLYAEGEHPTELIRQNKAARGIPTTGSKGSAGGSIPQGRTGKTVDRRDKEGRKVGKRAMTEKERKKTEAKEAKRERDQMVGKYIKLTQDGLGDVADLSEIFTNALKPPPPYPPSINLARYRIAGAIFLPLLLATAFVPSWVWTRGASFMLGFLFFGQPIMDRGLALFIEKVPDWKEKLDMRNSLLYGVPTNDQLVLHLLRVGENHGTPLPRPKPPPLAGTPKEALKDNAPNPDDELVDEDGNPMDVEDLGAKDKVMHKSKSKLVHGLKSLSKRVAGIGADVTVDGVKKQVGGKVDRLIWGSILKDDGNPESYPCKLNGKNGHLVLDPMSEYGVPTLAFRSAAIGDKHEFLRDINDIVEIKKAGISVPRAVLGWASGADVESQTLLMRMKSLGERQLSEMDGTKEVKGMNSTEGDSYEFQAVGRREQLFARLVSMGNQRWESL